MTMRIRHDRDRDRDTDTDTDHTTTGTAADRPDATAQDAGRTDPRTDGAALGPKTGHDPRAATGNGIGGDPTRNQAAPAGTDPAAGPGTAPASAARPATTPAGVAATDGGRARVNGPDRHNATEEDPSAMATRPGHPTAAAGTTTGTSGETGTSGGTGAGPSGGSDLAARMDHAIGGFVDDPKGAVSEAESVLDEAAQRLVRMVEDRRASLHESWQGADGSGAGTEELRVALTRIRDMARHLLDFAA
jgi:hypothetical protein